MLHEIESTLPDDLKLPRAIAAVCRYSDLHGYPISGCFELSATGRDDLRHWFKKNPADADHFLPFGRGATGDVYAIWLTEGLGPEDAPVVMFGSEGELPVLAMNAQTFCQLLCLGYSELGYFDDEDYDQPGSEFTEAQSFREFITRELDLEVPASGRTIISEAGSRFPDFKRWVEARID